MQINQKSHFCFYSGFRFSSAFFALHIPNISAADGCADNEE
jgi:hypothetical protein